MIISCPAKINETLTIGQPDASGYHPIDTVFQAVALYDTVKVNLSDEDSFACDKDLPGTNTVVRAWSLLREVAKLPPLEVKIEKQIPAQSGLGGGSSDAAGFLLGAKSLLNLTLGQGAVQDIALAVGADVPFFLRGGRAEGRGYGEILTLLPDPESRWLLIVLPTVTCSTKEMYEKLDAAGRPRKVANDFELVCPPECIELISRLRDLGSSQAGLSGSGSACFGYFASQNEADIAGMEFTGLWRRVVKTVARN